MCHAAALPNRAGFAGDCVRSLLSAAVDVRRGCQLAPLPASAEQWLQGGCYPRRHRKDATQTGEGRGRVLE